MPPMPTDRLDYTSPVIWTAFVRDTPLPQQFIGAEYLPFSDMDARQILVEIGKYGRPMLPFGAVGEEAHELDLGSEVTQALFKAFDLKGKIRFNAEDLRWIRQYGDRPVSDAGGRMAATQKARFRQAVVDLNDALDTRMEWLRISALCGAITEAPNTDSDLDVDIRYPVTTYTVPILWSDTENADPVFDIRVVTRAQSNLGITYADLIVGTEDYWNLSQNRRLREAGAGNALTFVPAYLSSAQINAVFGQFGIRVREYNSVYTRRTRDGTTGKFTDTAAPMLPQGTALLMPRAQVGTMGTVQQELNDWATGKYAWRNEPSNNPSMQDPIRHEFGIGWGGVPLMTFPQRVINLTVGPTS